MPQSLPTAGSAIVSISGPHLTRQTIADALSASGLGDVDVTWRSTDAQDPTWHITVVTGCRVVAGALPAGRQTVPDLAAYLADLLAG